MKNVVFEQYVLAHYSVPLFSELAKHVNLTIIVSTGKSVDGLKKVGGKLPFKVIELAESPRTGLFHPDLLKILEEEKADVLISFMTSIDRLLSDDTAYQSLQKMGVKVMVAGCDGYMYKTPIYALFRQFINPRMIMPTLASIKASRRLDHVLAYSSKTADYFAGARFVPRNRISITGNAIDTSMLNRTYHELMAAGVVRVPNKIVYAGRLSTGKKPRLLVEAFAEVIKKFPDATLEFVGEGSERGPAEELAKRLGVDSAVTFVGGVYDDKLMAEHLARASLAVMPALGGLGFNSAMACGLPLVYTDADGTENELFKEPGLGWYFDGTKKDLVRMISIALASPERMHEYGDEGEKVIMQKYTIANMVEKYVSAINHANQKTS